MADLVVDFSFSHPSEAAIIAAGFKGVMRYIPTGVPGKDFTNPEEKIDLDNHVPFGLVFETTAGRATQGAPAGQADAAFVSNALHGLGLDTNMPVYHAVDQDISSPAQVQPYFDSARSHAPYPVGLYGEYDLCEHFGAEGMKWLWQSYAWSKKGTGSGGSIQGQRLSKYARLFQMLGGATLSGTDVNVVLNPDWGQWPRPTATSPIQEEPVSSALVLDKSVPAPIPVFHVMGLQRLHVPDQASVDFLLALGATDLRGAPDDVQAHLITNSADVTPRSGAGGSTTPVTLHVTLEGTASPQP